MNEKTQKRLEALLSTFDSGAVQPDELIQAIDAVMAIVKSSNETIAKKVGENDSATKTKFTELEREVDAALRQLDSYNKKLELDKATKVDVDRLASNLKAEIARVASLIPELPDEFDASDLYENIEAQRGLIENISSLIVGENLRNALEALPDGEKLAIEAVEGLREELDKLAKDWRKGGSGGGLGSQIVLDIIAQAVADGTIPSGSGVSDGDKGDITVSSGGTVWTIDNDTIGLDELSATGTPDNTKFLRGDNTWAVPAGSGSGIVETIVAGTGITVDDTDPANPIVSATGGGGGINRTIVVTSGNVTAGSAASTDYVYKVAGAHTVTLPTAVSNNNQYDIINLHSASVSLATTSSQTIHGTAAPITLIPNQSLTLQSDGTNWMIK